MNRINPDSSTNPDALTKADKLGALVNFLGTLLGILASIWIASKTFSDQEKSTRSLESKLRYSEIVTELHSNIRTCKESLRSVSTKIRKEGFDQYLNLTNNAIVSCRSDLLPFIGALRIFNRGEFGFSEREYLLRIDDRLASLRDFIASLIRQPRKLEAQHYLRLNNLMVSIAKSSDQSLATLDGLEKLLIAN